MLPKEIEKAPDKELEANEQRPHKVKVSVVKRRRCRETSEGKGVTPLHPCTTGSE